jgi:hypothetical protein
MQEIPESVQSTVNSINQELRKSPAKALVNAGAFPGKPIKRAAVSGKVFGNLTPNDTKRERSELASN